MFHGNGRDSSKTDYISGIWLKEDLIEDSWIRNPLKIRNNDVDVINEYLLIGYF